ncbi:hypothetical protein U9M48_016003 [Paspalum notatum var. saurae]|uniref:Plant heme peroxidase family profile domain-containing protein n=1 Tax=Paspalum notatum var. saurae TaxID=547442 RepID=A0AAQ3WM33_PASNO
MMGPAAKLAALTVLAGRSTALLLVLLYRPKQATYSPVLPSTPPPPSSGNDAGTKLKVGYYRNKCGRYVDVEAIVRKHAGGFDAGMQAGLVRLFFQDCFVRVYHMMTLCVPLLITTHARHAVGAISFAMPAGRYDGAVSFANETLPKPAAALRGAPAAPAHVRRQGPRRLRHGHALRRPQHRALPLLLLHRPPPAPSNTSDMNPALAAQRQGSCASPNGTDNTVMQDQVTPNVLDNQYYKNVLAHRVLFTSDAALTTGFMTNNLVRAYAELTPYLWQRKFGQAMVKMGRQH